MWPRRCEVETVTEGGARPVVSFGFSSVPPLRRVNGSSAAVKRVRASYSRICVGRGSDEGLLLNPLTR